MLILTLSPEVHRYCTIYYHSTTARWHGYKRHAESKPKVRYREGNNKVPSEDALVLQLLLAKGQEKMVETLKGQRDEIRELQHRLSEQQGTLVKAQYDLLLESVKQMSFQGMQEELECHMVALRGQARADHRQAYAVHKVDMEASVMCQGLSEREASAGLCGHAYFYNSEMEECQAFQECEAEPVATPCTSMSDTVCSTPSPTDSRRLSLAWAGDVILLPSKSHAPGHAFPNLQLHIQGRGEGELLSTEDGHLVLRQHGLVWADENLALSHGCRSFVQLCLRLNASDGAEERDLSGVRVEQREGKLLQSASISGVAEVAPGSMVSQLLRSASHHRNCTSDSLHLHDPSAPPLSLIWLSHDTGAVAMMAQAVSTSHYHTNYRPAFQTTSTSDPYVVGLTHDGHGVRFTESGTVRFVFQQALYSMGQTCLTKGFHLLAYINRNGSNMELARTYRDTSISLLAATWVSPVDSLGFEIPSPGQCNIRYFGDDSGISGLSLACTPEGYFRQVSPHVLQVQVGLPMNDHTDHQRDFVFWESGTVSLALDLKLIHSCNLVKVTLIRRRGEGAGEEGKSLPQQVGGQMPDGSE
ncbi:unnamed protein product [Coregonus sp. 'balchen']|nr:unnamed protein product [Coregonus sp. 'balchen']